jgi:outer membrane protein assembly factor BamB
VSESPGDGGLMDSYWPMFQYDIRHTGQSPYGKPGTWYKEKWYIELDSWCDSSPVIDKNGTIYIGSSWYLFAINPNGTLKWKYKTWGNIDSAPALAEDGTIYAGSNEGYLYAISPNGTKKWKTSVGGWSTSPVIDENGTIYTGSTNGRIYAINPNGTKKWSYKTDYYIFCSPVIDNDTLYCGSYDTYIYAIYKNNGTLKWRYNTPEWCFSLAIGNDNTIYCGQRYDYLFAIKPNGTLKWRKKLGNFLIASPAIAEDGTIYAIADDYAWLDRSHIYSINSDGTINWKYTYYDADIVSSPAIDKYGIIYIGTRDGWLLALNPDCNLRWSFQALENLHSSPAIGEDGTIYFASFDTSTPDFFAYLHAIEPIDDNPPDKPLIDGPTNGLINIEYNYSAVTTEPDGDNISYYFNWGDGKNSGWTEFMPSGTIVNLSHSWGKSGTYTIKVKAKDDYGMESEWGELQVTMPRNKAVSSSLLLRFLERYPLLNRLLNILVK